MKKVKWKVNQVISIETRRKDENRKENIYVLAQMFDEAQLLVFNLFNNNNIWENINLNEAPILFGTYVTRQFLYNSNIYKQNIEPLKDYQFPEHFIEIKGMGFREITLWEGTPDEQKILMMGEGGGWLIKGDNLDEKIAEVSFTDNEMIDRYELDNVRIYAEFNERLYLCYKFGKNVDPMKDLVFNRPIPLEYKEYMYIISS